jgi:hypothetical protein
MINFRQQTKFSVVIGCNHIHKYYVHVANPGLVVKLEALTAVLLLSLPHASACVQPQY